MPIPTRCFSVPATSGLHRPKNASRHAFDGSRYEKECAELLRQLIRTRLEGRRLVAVGVDAFGAVLFGGAPALRHHHPAITGWPVCRWGSGEFAAFPAQPSMCVGGSAKARSDGCWSGPIKSQCLSGTR
jgi:hypothetical protein